MLIPRKLNFAKLIERRPGRSCLGITAMGLLGFFMMSSMSPLEAFRSTPEVFVSLADLDPGQRTQISCAFGQVEDMSSQNCVWPTLTSTGRASKVTLDDVAEARLKRVLELLDDGQLKDGLALLTPLLSWGHPRAQFLTSELYRRGDALPQNKKLSMELLRVAASQGDASSQFALAHRLTEDCAEDCSQILEAIPLFLAASEAGYDKATEALARIYYLGIGVEENKQKALPFIMKAAEAGLSKSQRILGSLYDEGVFVEGSPELALKWYEKAAKLGDLRAMTRVGLMYFQGQGAQENFVRGLGYLWTAAKAGEGLAQCFLGEGMLNEWFNVSDRLSGLMWLKLAKKSDEECGGKLLEHEHSPLTRSEDQLTDHMAELCLSGRVCGSKPWEWDSVHG